MFKTVTALPALFSTLPTLFSRVFVPDLQLAVKASAAAGLQIVVHKVLSYAESSKTNPYTKEGTKTFVVDRVRWIPKPNTVSLGIIGAVALLRFYNFSSLSSAVASVGMLVGVEGLIFSGITWLEANLIDLREEEMNHPENKTIIQNRFSTLRASIFAGMAFLALRTAGSITSQSHLITLGNGGMIASLVSSVGICALTLIELVAFDKFRAEDPKIRPLILKSVTQGASLGLTALVTGAVGFILKHSGRSFQGSLAYWAALLMTNGVASLYVSTKLRVTLEQADKKGLPELTQTHLMTIVKALQGLILAGPGVLIANKAIQSLGSVYLLSARSLKIGFSLLAIGSIGGASYFVVETKKEFFRTEKNIWKNLGKLKQLAQTNFEWFQKIHGLLLGTAAVWSTGYWLNVPRLNFWSSRTTGVLLIADIWMVYKTYTEIDRDLSSAGGIDDRRAQLNLIGWEGTPANEDTNAKDRYNYRAYQRVSYIKTLSDDNRLSILDLFNEMTLNTTKLLPNFFQPLPASVLACFIKLYLYRQNDSLSRPDALLAVKGFCNFYCPDDQKTLEGLMNTLPQDISSYLKHEELSIFLEASLLEKADDSNPQTEAKSHRAALQMERKRFMMSMDERVGTAATFDELKYLSGAIDRCDFSKISGDYSLLYQVYCYYFDWAIFNQNEERDHVAAADVHAKETMRRALSHCDPEMLKNLLYVATKEKALSHLLELFTENQAYSVAFEEQHSPFFRTGNLGLVMKRVNQLKLQKFDLVNIDLSELLGRNQIGNGTGNFTLELSGCENFQPRQIIELMKSRTNPADGDRIKLRIVFEKMTYDVTALEVFYGDFKDGTDVTLESSNCKLAEASADTWGALGYTDDHFTAILEKYCPKVPIPWTPHLVYKFETMLPPIFKMALEEGAKIGFPYASGRPATSWALNCLNDNNEKNALAKVKMFLERGLQQGFPVEHLDFRNWQTPNLLETLRAIYPIKSQQGAMIHSLNLMNVVVSDEDVRNLLLLFPKLQELYLGKANITEAALRNIKIKEWTDGKLIVKNDDKSFIG